MFQTREWQNLSWRWVGLCIHNNTMRLVSNGNGITIIIIIFLHRVLTVFSSLGSLLSLYLSLVCVYFSLYQSFRMIPTYNPIQSLPGVFTSLRTCVEGGLFFFFLSISFLYFFPLQNIVYGRPNSQSTKNRYLVIYGPCFLSSLSSLLAPPHLCLFSCSFFFSM